MDRLLADAMNGVLGGGAGAGCPAKAVEVAGGAAAVVGLWIARRSLPVGGRGGRLPAELMIDSQNGFRDAQVGGFDDGGATGDAETGKNTVAGDSAGPGGRSVGRGRIPRSRDR